VEIQLLTRVVLVDIDAITIDRVNRVFNAIDSSSDWLFSNTDGVTETPAEELALCVEVERSRSSSEAGKVKGLDLGMSSGEGSG
jgi:hypothetical protein